MGELGPVPGHGVVDHALAEGVGQVVVAPDDVGDGHVVVVHHHRVQVGRRAVAAQDDHVVQLGMRHADLALHQVGHHHLAAGGRLDADDRRQVARLAALPAGAVVLERALGGLGLGAHRRQLLLRVEGQVGLALGQQLARHLGVAGLPLALEHRRLVGRKPQPGQAFEDLVDSFLRAALLVGILDAQQVLAAVAPGEQVVEQRGAGAADVQVAGGGGREAGTDGHGRNSNGRVQSRGLARNAPRRNASPQARLSFRHDARHGCGHVRRGDSGAMARGDLPWLGWRDGAIARAGRGAAAGGAWPAGAVAAGGAGRRRAAVLRPAVGAMGWLGLGGAAAARAGLPGRAAPPASRLGGGAAGGVGTGRRAGLLARGAAAAGTGATAHRDHAARRGGAGGGLAGRAAAEPGGGPLR